MLELKNIKGGYLKGNPVLKGVNLKIWDDEVVSIVGQNGAGKSTLAKAIMNMIPEVTGEIIFNNESIKNKNTEQIVSHGLKYFIQGGAIFPHLTIDENLTFAGIGLKKKDIKTRKKELISYFNLFQNEKGNRLTMRSSYLSVGEQHQLALGMVFMRKSKFLILDEPSAGLSPANVKNFYRILDNIRKHEKISILLIEQNVAFAVKFSSRIVLLKNGVIHNSIDSKSLDCQDKIDNFFFGDIKN